MRLLSFEKSTRDGKKYMVVVEKDGKKKTIHFGSEGYEDYNQHKSEKRKESYISRHKSRENWTDPLTAGFWAKHLLWGDTTDLQKNLQITKKKFDL